MAVEIGSGEGSDTRVFPEKGFRPMREERDLVRLASIGENHLRKKVELCMGKLHEFDCVGGFNETQLSEISPYSKHRRIVENTIIELEQCRVDVSHFRKEYDAFLDRYSIKPISPGYKLK
jgi:hypothetical protein